MVLTLMVLLVVEGQCFTQQIHLQIRETTQMLLTDHHQNDEPNCNFGENKPYQLRKITTPK